MDQLNNYFDNILKTDNIKHITKWVKGQISGLRLFLATESPSKRKKKKKKKKKEFFFTLKALFALKICKILS